MGLDNPVVALVVLVVGGFLVWLVKGVLTSEAVYIRDRIAAALVRLAVLVCPKRWRAIRRVEWRRGLLEIREDPRNAGASGVVFGLGCCLTSARAQGGRLASIALRVVRMALPAWVVRRVVSRNGAIAAVAGSITGVGLSIAGAAGVDWSVTVSIGALLTALGGALFAGLEYRDAERARRLQWKRYVQYLREVAPERSGGPSHNPSDRSPNRADAGPDEGPRMGPTDPNAT